MKTTADIIAITLLSLAPCLHAPAAAASDLVDAWQSARQHDPVFEAARAQRQAGEARQRQGNALLLPQIAASASGGYAKIDNNTTGAQFSAPGFGASNDAAFRTRIDGGQATGWAINAQQPIYNAERLANSRQLGTQAQLAEVQFRATEQELILRTAQAYFAVLLAEETLSTTLVQKDAAARALDVANERFDAGAAPVTDREEAKARFDDILSQELLARDELQLKQIAFLDLTGTSAIGLRRPAAGELLGRFSVGPLAAWSERAAQHNPLIEMQAMGLDIARDEVEKFRAIFSPSLDLVARVADDRINGSYGSVNSSITTNSRTVGLQLTIPLYSGGMRSAKHDEAVALARKAEFDGQALRQEVLRQTQASWLGVTTGISRVNARAQALRSAQTRLNATETGNEVGARTMLDLMNAQTDFFQAQRNLAQAKYQLLLDRLRLSAAAGELSDAELRDVNAVLAAGAPALP